MLTSLSYLALSLLAMFLAFHQLLGNISNSLIRQDRLLRYTIEETDDLIQGLKKGSNFAQSENQDFRRKINISNFHSQNDSLISVFQLDNSAKGIFVAEREARPYISWSYFKSLGDAFPKDGQVRYRELTISQSTLISTESVDIELLNILPTLEEEFALGILGEIHIRRLNIGPSSSKYPSTMGVLSVSDITIDRLEIDLINPSMLFLGSSRGRISIQESNIVALCLSKNNPWLYVNTIEIEINGEVIDEETLASCRMDPPANLFTKRIVAGLVE